MPSESLEREDVVGIPKAEARRRFILNKIYRVQEGTTADDLFIVDEKANKWAVEDVSDATAGATTNSVAQIVSGNIVSGWMGMIKSRSINSTTPHSPRTTPHEPLPIIPVLPELILRESLGADPEVLN